MATLGTAAAPPAEIYVTKNALGSYTISDTATSSASVKYSATELTKREQFALSALNGFCAKGEGLSPTLTTMAIKAADDVIAALAASK